MLENEIEGIKKEIDKIIYSIPNIALDDVPIGADEKKNKIIKKVGIRKNLLLILNPILI